jgi:hypothetical protein
MFRILRCITLVAVLLATLGCSQNYYNVPRESFEKKVRVIGVAPIFVDADSDIRLPDKEALVNLVKDANRKNSRALVSLLKENGGFFAVRPLDDDPDKLFAELMFRRERRDDAGIVYNKYFFKGDALRELITKNNLDAVMVVVVSGMTKRDKIYSSNIFSYLESDYNRLIMTAQIIDADGMILWEYPNFRQQHLSFSPFFVLQYPDFDEAKANETDKVEVRFKTIPGITRAFDNSTDVNGVKVSRLYNSIFDDMMSVLGPEKDLFGTKKMDQPQQANAKPAEK